MYFFDTFSLTTRITSFMMLISLVVIQNFEVYKVNVKIAILNSDLEGEININLSNFCVSHGQENKVYKMLHFYMVYNKLL